MKKDLLKPIVAILLIITLTMANFILLGVNAVSYAANTLSQGTKTNNENVTFDAYLENEKLYMQVSVKNDGYFNGTIALENGNFKLKNEVLSDKINKIEGNTITLKQINSGATAEIEVGIEAIKDDSISPSLLNMSSTIAINGTYKNSSEKDITIQAKRQVQLILNSPYAENEGIELTSENLTNKIFKINGENKRIVQVLVKSGLAQNAYPIKETNISLSVPEGVEDVNVISRGTIATNGKAEDSFNTSNWKYNENEKTVSVKIQNNEENGKISWLKEGKDQIVVTYIMNENSEIKNTEIIAKSTITLYDTSATTKQIETKNIVTEEKDGIITSEIKTSESSIYKGKIYSGEEREYNVTANIYANNSKTGKKIDMSLGAATYETDTAKLEANAQYLKTTISKAQITKVLGESGELKILNSKGETITNITSTTATDENGNIVVNYPEGTKTIKVVTSPVTGEGTITLNTTKAIKKETYNRDIIASVKTLKEIAGSETATITLKDTATQAKLEANRTTLSTMEKNTGFEIRATLKTNSEENDLYKNPVVKIAIPSQVEKIDVNSINLLYEDELKITSANTHEENGVKIIEIALAGEQTKHKEGTNIEGATIIVNANLTLNKRATSSDEAIRMTVTNENTGTQANVEKGIEIVSPRGIVTINSINDYGMSVIGEAETKTAKLELGGAAKQTTVDIEIINNNEVAINDVKILGDFPTQNTNNTIKTQVSAISNLSVANAVVYYTENGDATDNLTEESNGWTQEFKDGAKVKKYLITVPSMEVAGSLSASYTLNIPEGLGYNEQAYEGYKVVYTESTTNMTNEIAGATLGLSTGKGPELTTKLTAKVGKQELSNGDKVATGEVIKYTLELENTGTESATNINIKGAIPEGTKQVEKATADDETNEVYKQMDNKEFNTQIESIAAGEKKTVEYEVKVTPEAEENTEISNKMNATYNALEANTDAITLNTEKTDISVEISNSKYLDENTKFMPGDNVDYYVYITNTSNSKMQNVQLKWNIPEKTAVSYQERIYNLGQEDERVEELEAKDTITIPEIEANSTAIIRLSLQIQENIESTEELAVSAVVSVDGNNSESNELNTKVYGTENANIVLTTNKENGYLLDGDEVQYKIVATNNNEIAINGALITDKVPKELTILKVTVNGEEQNIKDIKDNTVTISRDLAKGESVEVVINAIVNYDETRTEATTITNKAELMLTSQMTKTSEEVSHILIASTSDIVNAKNMISGTAWFDENEDGKRDSSEKLLEGITVRLIDASTGNIAKNSQDKELVAQTNSKGLYLFSEVPEGEYIVAFEFDTSTYVVTSYQKEGVPETNNSDAITKQFTINGEVGTYAVTDTITMEESGVSNIDLGLITSTTFDLELNKYVSKIVVQTSQGTSTYEYNKETLAKVEIAAKRLSGATVIVEYQIDVTNTGELAGYVKNVVDYMPSDLKFSSELNTDWYQSGSNLYNTSLANTKLAAGETKTLTLTLTKAMTEENTGLVNNTAEIAESYNESGIQDVDSTAGNQTQGEDDMGAADVIIGVKTGAMITYIGLTISIIAIIATGAYFVGRRIAKAHEIKVNL